MIIIAMFVYCVLVGCRYCSDVSYTILIPDVNWLLQLRPTDRPLHSAPVHVAQLFHQQDCQGGSTPESLQCQKTPQGGEPIPAF